MKFKIATYLNSFHCVFDTNLQSRPTKNYINLQVDGFIINEYKKIKR